jgi:hypothetical protein
MQNITEAVNIAAGEEVTAILNMYKDEIQKAYLKKEGTLVVPFTIKFKQGESSDSLEVEAYINFTPDKIKDSVLRLINESQGTLPGVEKEGKKK